MSDTHLPPFWAERLLAVLGGKQRAESLRFLHAWAQAEGGSARWNPLNSTLGSPGSGFTIPGASPLPGNTAGVQNYPRPTWGICATALTLTTPAFGTLEYGHIVAALQAGTQTAEEIVRSCRDQIAAWGTNPDEILRILAA